MIYFETRGEFYFAGLKAHTDEGGGRILLGDNTGSWTLMLLTLTSQCVGVWISTGVSYMGHRRPFAFEILPCEKFELRLILWNVITV